MNPFDNTVAINDPKKLFGRRHELRGIYSALGNNQCISLYGLPRIGKTSILKCLPFPELQQQFGGKLERCIFVYIDMEEHLQKTSRDFFETLCRYIVNQSRGLLELVYTAGRGEDSFTDILEQIVDQNFHLVLEMDMFDKIVKNAQFDDYFLGFLRAQVNTKGICYITASVVSLDKISQHFDPGSPFFNVFGNCNLGPLAREDAQKLTQMASNPKECSFSKEEIEWVLELAGLHPFFIQRVCYYLYEAKLSQDIIPINQNQVRDQAYNALLSSFFYIWKNLNSEKQELLKYEGPREIPELAECTLFREFVRDECHVQPFDMIAELEEALDKIDNLKSLGESRLIYLTIVSQNLRKDIGSLPVEKGLIVRQVLKAAFERMRGSDIRNDSDPKLKSYNILYYRYFKHHLKIAHIAARLHFSVRQYYRYRKQAIEELAIVLAQMENAANSKDQR